MERSRLAALWFADIAGFTGLSARDEDTALAVVRALQRIARTEVKARQGRIVKLTGDGVLAVFESIDQALRAALALRRDFLGADLVTRAGVSLRIGVHLGEIAEAVDGDVYGDGVNVASRLQVGADPGQIMISEAVYLQIRQRPSYHVEPLGERQFRGHTHPLLVYGIDAADEQAGHSIADLLQDAVKPIQVLDRVAAGGMGEIYLGRDPALRRTVAIKVLQSRFARDPVGRARFFREAQAIASISHPNVVGIHSVSELTDGTPYFVMDFIEGESLAARIERQGSFTVAEARRTLVQVAAALAAAHARGVVHRDIKPSNVLLDENGRVLVSDFGVAAFHSPEESTADHLTDARTILGSPEFMSPEQVLGEVVTPASDIYALGVLAHHLLLGHGPFETPTPQRLMVAHVKDEPPPLRSLRDDVDPEFEALVGKCLRKDATQRPRADELARLLSPRADAWLEWPPPGLEKLQGQMRPVAAAFAVAFLLLGGPILLASTTADQGSVEFWFPATLAANLVGVIATVVALVRVLRLSRLLWNGSQLGYSLSTLFDVLSDVRRDTGKLVTGRREYALLEHSTRMTMRRNRVLRESGLLLGALTLIPATVLALGIAAQTRIAGGPTVLLALAPAALLGSIAVMLALIEHWPLYRARRAQLRTASTAQTVGPLVTPWYKKFQQATQSDDSPRPRLAMKTIGSLNVVVLLVFVASLVAMSGLIFTGVSEFDNERPIDLDQQLYTQFEAFAPLQSLRLPVDSSIGPLDARAVLAGTRDTTWRRHAPGQTLVKGSGPTADESTLDALLAADSLIPVALGRGFTKRERAYIAGFLQHPAREALARTARAHSFASVHPGSIGPASHPLDTVKAGVGNARELAYVKIAEAALRAEDGDLASAETILREPFSAGFLIAEDAIDHREHLQGVAMAISGLRALRTFYEHTGRTADAERVSTALLEPDPLGNNRPWSSATGREFEYLREVLLDRERARAHRWRALTLLVVKSSCETPGGLIRGPSEPIRQAITRVRPELAQTQDEAALFDSIVEWAERFQSDQAAKAAVETNPVIGSRWLRNIGGFLDLNARLLQNPRIYSCFMSDQFQFP